MKILGHDPGQKGGFAILDTADAGSIIASLPVPLATVRTKVALDGRVLVDWYERFGPVDMAVIELVHSMPRMGAPSVHQFGRMFGGGEALLRVMCRCDYVDPGVWKRAMGLPKDKQASLDLATQLFGYDVAQTHWPLAKHEGVAEAALIATYWWRKNGV